jgi:hypothetical protein
MKQMQITVKGQSRKVYIERAITVNSWQARTYVGSKVVSGTLSRNINGHYRFTPSGVNAGLV